MITYQEMNYKQKNNSSMYNPHFYKSGNTYSDSYLSDNDIIKNVISEQIIADINTSKKEKEHIIPTYAKLELLYVLFASLSLTISSIVLLLLIPTNSLGLLFLFTGIGFLGLFFPLLYISRKLS